MDSRMCKPKACFKLFGVNILDKKSIERTVSMGNLQPRYTKLEQRAPSKRPRTEKRKPWTEREHRMFLEGLKIHGKGKWKRISESHVITRTPMQIASHAQKFFIRQALGDKGRNRSSIFDSSSSEEFALVPLQDSPPSAETMNNTSSQVSASSSAMPFKQHPDIPEQASTSSQALNPVITKAANHGNPFPNYLGIRCLRPCYVNVAGNGNLGKLIFLPPAVVHPLSIAAPTESSQQDMLEADPEISIEEDLLELKLGSSQ